MPDEKSRESTDAEHSYLDVGPIGPRRWVLAVGALLLVGAVVAAFYGLYTINRGPTPTLSPEPAALTEVALAGTPGLAQASPSIVPTLTAPTTTPTATLILTPTAEPATYTVQQGDSLIAIASRLNVDVDDLTALNQVSGETIFPDQVLLVPPTVTPWPEGGPFLHIVRQGETLLTIAAFYQVNVEDMKTLNGLTSDTIFSGQQILIPAGGVRPPTPTPTPEPWRPAVITGELDASYTLMTVDGRVTLHIPPDTRAASASETSTIAELVETGLGQIQKTLLRRLAGRLEVYVADTLFDAPYTARRSFSLPTEGRLFLLYDGTGSRAERLYFITYALTPLMAARLLGEPASPLLGEGLAVYAAGQTLVGEMRRGRSYLSPEQFCAAYQQAGRLPSVSRELTFEGHLGHLDQHFAAGCFVSYLIEEGGRLDFRKVYLNGDYRAVYGRTLNQLEADWGTLLTEAAAELPFDPEDLVNITTAVNEAYLDLWTDFEGTPAQFVAYERLDRARLSLLQGQLDAAETHLRLFEGLRDSQ